MRRRHTLLIYVMWLLLFPCLGGCSEEDDVEEIFVSGRWYVVDYYTKANWSKRSGNPRYNSMLLSSNMDEVAAGRKALETIHEFNITFGRDGKLTGNVGGGSLEGTWQADGEKRTVHVTVTRQSGASSTYVQEFIETLKEVAFYQGDSNVLLLAPEDKKSYIQFTHRKQDE